MSLQLTQLDPTLVALILPLIAIQLVLLVAAIVDLLRVDRAVRGGNKGLWAVVIVFVNLIGPVLYFLVGRVDGVPEPTAPPGAMPGWGSPHDPPPAAAGGDTARTPGYGAPTTPAATGPSAAAAATGPSSAAPARATAVLEPTVHAALVSPAPPAATTTTIVAREAPARGEVDPGAPPAISVERLTRRYPGGVLALDGLTMSVPSGSVFGLLGPNGAGKTTTLRLLAGLTRATSGRATVRGLDVAVDPLEVRRHLGYLEQDPRTYGWMTGREQLRMLGRLHGMDGRALETGVAEALSRVDLAAAADRRTATYSGGMRQRLGIAGALVHRPPVIVLDEPVSSLDPEGRRDVLDLIAALRGETTVLFSTHVLADVERICDRIAILDHGRLIVEGRLSDLLDRYALPVWRIEAEPGQAAELGSLAETLRREAWVDGVSLDHGLLTVAVAEPTSSGPAVLAAVVASGVAVIAVGRARPTLEDVFLRLTSEAGATSREVVA